MEVDGEGRMNDRPVRQIVAGVEVAQTLEAIRSEAEFLWHLGDVGDLGGCFGGAVIMSSFKATLDDTKRH